MQDKSTQSPVRKCTTCGIEKPLSEDYFQPVRSFAKGYSFYCNDCDTESRRQKSFAPPVLAVDRVNGDNGLSLDVDSPA